MKFSVSHAKFLFPEPETPSTFVAVGLAAITVTGLAAITVTGFVAAIFTWFAVITAVTGTVSTEPCHWISSFY